MYKILIMSSVKNPSAYSIPPTVTTEIVEFDNIRDADNAYVACKNAKTLFTVDVIKLY